MNCMECGRGHMVETVLPEHLEDLGGIVVNLINAVRVYRCDHCGAEETEIPDLRGLVRAVAMARAVFPVQLTGKDILFMRRALDMTQSQFAEAMGLRLETVSRWENGVRGIGGMSDKLVRHNVCALLHAHVPALDYDPVHVTRMRIVPMPEGQGVAPLRVRRVIVKRDHRREDAWDALPMAA
jgi:DNA-binding XRE family transcriptional regulator